MLTSKKYYKQLGLSLDFPRYESNKTKLKKFIMNTILSRDTLLPISAVILIVTASFWIASKLSEIDYKLHSIERNLADKSTKYELENWALRLQLSNPELTVPEVKE